MSTVRLRNLVRRPEVVAVAFIGLMLRCWVLLTPSGNLFADEAVTGLSALDVSQGRFGILIPGNNYTALVESYLFAPVVQVFGTSVTLLKLMPIFLWFVASVLAGLVSGRLTGPRSAVVTFSLLWLVPGALLIVSTRAYLGYAGGLVVVMGALLTLVATAQGRVTRRRSLVAGGLVGLAFIMHPIYLAGLGVAALVVTWEHRRDVRGWYGPFVLGLLIGCSPWLVWNVRNDFASFSEQDTEPSTFIERVRGTFSGLLPRDLGLRDLRGDWVVARPVAVLLTIVFLVALGRSIVVLWRRGAAGRVIALPALTSWFTLAVFAHTSFVLDGRYGILPFPYAVVALGAALGADRVSGRAQAVRRRCVVWVVGWVVLLVLPYQWRVVGTEFGDPNALNAAVVRALDERGVNHVVGDYFDVLQLSYVTEGRIATKVFFPLPVRYPHLERRVDAASPDRVAFLFLAGAMKESDLKLPLTAYERIDLPGYELYVPYEGAG